MKRMLLPLLLAALLVCAGCTESVPPVVPDAASEPIVVESGAAPAAQAAPAPTSVVLSVDEAAALLEEQFGKVDEQTGNQFSFGFVEPMTLDGTDYLRFRVSWLVDNDHLSYLTDYLVALDGSELREYLPPTEQGGQPEQGAQAVLPTAYAAIVAQYADAVRNGFYADVASESRDAAFGQDVALEWRIAPQDAYYALADLDGNGVMELIVAAGADTTALTLYDLFCLDGETAVRPFDMDFGYRANLDVYADGSVAVRWSNSAFEAGVDRYRIEGTRAIRTDTLYTTADPDAPDKLLYWQNDAKIEQAAFEEASSALDAAASTANALDWIAITG